jgi:hypothetical protein
VIKIKELRAEKPKGRKREGKKQGINMLAERYAFFDYI